MAGKGGKRPGAGRKSKAVKLVEAGFVANYFDSLAQDRFWKSMLASEDERIRLDAGKYLTDRLYGKAPQALDLTSKGKEILTQVVVNL